ncbi:hypothetical protein RGQ13_06300 [Thalassotalea psychrophila]|uniref:Neuromedin U n=1 Tax=Thalassotalea psychrophila TaxID=3065647 RepID=A0ABY9TXW0_9GAMM|nr:hypothetical protein RGQ13_06300 [Colwelliaceae bacterium SQ149]
MPQSFQRKSVTKLALALLASMSFSALSAEENAADKAAKELANPNTAFASLNFKFQHRTYEGDIPGADDQDGQMILFQPSLPFPREDGTKIIWRPAVPIHISTPWQEESGLGDISMDVAYAFAPPKDNPGELMAVGVFTSLPTGDEKVGGGEATTLGPEFLWGQISADGIIGMFPNHQWDVAGDIDISITSSQFFYVKLPGGGWNYGTSPTLSYDHKAEEWTIPLNFSFGKTVMFGTRPWKLGMEINYYVEKPDDFGPEWMISFNVSPVVENVMANWFR